jgi:hypothetical protein
MDIIGMVKEVSGAIKELGGIVDDLHLSKEEKLNFHEALSNIILKLNELAVKVTELASKIIMTETQSDSWLAKNWRPIAMLSFLYIIIHTIVLVPIFHIPGVADAVKNVPDQMWTLLTYGLSGYVIGRTIEKSIDKVSIKNLLDKLIKK